MRKFILFLIILYSGQLSSQVQISNFSYNSVQNSAPYGYLVFNNKLYFTAVNDGLGREIWSTDGTSANTNLFFELSPGETDGVYTFYNTTLNNNLFFVANQVNQYSDNGTGEIWKTNGTSEGSEYVTNYTGRIMGLTTVGNYIYYFLRVGNYDLQLWKTDGTSSGTILVKNILDISNGPSYQGSINGKFIFTLTQQQTNNVKVWRSDGTESGTYAITSEIDGVGIGAGTISLSHYITYNNNLYFVTRTHLYKTDGTTANSITPLWNANTNLVDFGDAVVINDKMYFSYFSKNLKKLSIYQSDGTASGTSEVYTVTSSHYFYPSYLIPLENNLIFSSINSDNGTSIYYLNTVTNLVSEIIEVDQNPIEPSTFGGDYLALTMDQINDNLFFVTSPKDVAPLKKGRTLDTSTMTLTHIEHLDNLYPGPGHKIIFNNDLFYTKDYQVWRLGSNNLNISSTKNIELHLFPNPAYNNVYINNTDDIFKIEIYDLNGKICLKYLEFTNNTFNIDSLVQGTYIVKIKTKNNEIITRKLIKK